jgi:lactate racemase
MEHRSREHSIRWGSRDLAFDLPQGVHVEEASPAIGASAKGIDDTKEESLVDARITKELSSLSGRIKKASRILVVSDDNTRVTPVKALLPPIIAVAKDLGKQVSIIVAGGSHRHMTTDEKRIKFGAAIVDDIPILDHAWSDESTLVNFGKSRGGYDIKLAKVACEPGTFVVGLGNIVPHRVCGFSGGYKILMPGLTCQATMNRIHYASAAFTSEQILGVVKNPMRDAINEIGLHRPIDFLVNTVLDGASRIVSLCLGDPVESQFQGAGIAKEIYGVKIGTPADVVIADAVPEHIDWWLCAKAACNCKSFVKPGGHLVLLTPCTEGWSPAHEGVLLKYGYHPPADIDVMVKDGRISPDHLLEASHLAHIGEVLAHCRVHLISDTLDKKGIGKQGFDVVRSRDFSVLVHELITGQQKSKPKGQPLVKIVRRGAEILPLQ